MWIHDKPWYRDEENGGDPPANGDGGTPPADPGDGKQMVPSGDGGTPPADSGDGKPFFSQLPETWRKDLAGDDEKIGKWIERYNDLPSVIQAGFNAADKIRRGEISSGLPENPTDEQLAEWRQANGVPESPDKYELHLEDGLVLGEEDERILQYVLPVAFETNVPGSTMAALTTAMLKGRQVEEEVMLARDGEHSKDAINVVKQTWGPDFQTNINMAQMMVNRLPESVRELMMNARLADGRGVMNSPEVLIWLSDAMRQIDPAATVISDGHNATQGINDEIAKLEKQMADGIADGSWYKDTAANKRLEDLYEARDRLKAQAG